MLRSTIPSARSAFRPTSFFEPSGAALPDSTRPASITTSSGEGPEPSICMLQRMHLPRFGIPCGSGRLYGVVDGSEPGPSARPITATSAWAFGQWNWYSYETAPEPWSEVVRYLSHSFGNAGTARELGSV